MKKLIIYLSFFILVSCGNSIEFKERPEEFFQGDFPLSALTFDNVNKEIFQKSCTQCHRGYSDYQSVFNDKDKIMRAVLQNRMPKNAPALNDELKGLLAAWVQAGAPRGAGSNQEPPQLLEATWESLSVKVFFPKCVQCHNPNGQASFLDLSDRQKFFDNRDELLNNFEDVENSFLIEVLRDPEEPMPPGFSGLNPLSENEITTIIEWIQKGLP